MVLCDEAAVTRWIDGLKCSSLQSIAPLRLQGCSIDKIARRLGYTKRTVQRRLDLSRKVWRELLDVED